MFLSFYDPGLQFFSSIRGFFVGQRRQLVLVQRNHLTFDLIAVQDQQLTGQQQRATRIHIFKTRSVLFAKHKTRGVSCRKTSKEGHAEKSGVALYVLAAQLSVCVCVLYDICYTTYFRTPSPTCSRMGKKNT